ncbi:O-antigen ligase domain-containing protein [Flavobacterium sufflavum]|uniref:O-antigen ligase domain-containing protein n=1 Tax=Flavobacterium sufflavum TaxID=1921138 RepID=A0A3S2V496_9FLAO|nr:O-antigen ligase family protein [Flavobacterium sufflavum]RVT75902.1 O-antigen ligase domain-containing protein [Flavobacterium sufflavum]
MSKSEINYINLVLIHIGIAVIIFYMPFLSKIYALLISVFGFYYIIKKNNKDNEVLYVSAYLVGAEVFLRMTGGNLNNEYVKVVVSLLMLLGFVLSGFSKSSIVYWLYFLLLIPAVFITMTNQDVNVEVRKAITFNISGPICLGLCALYCYRRRLAYSQLQNVVILFGLPIIAVLVYLLLFNPSVRDVVRGTQSNFATSGGYGPNQVATILGLGMFVFFCQLIFMSKSRRMMALNVFLFVITSYRAIVTFSRGGVITGFAMIVFMLIAAYLFSNSSGKRKLKWIVFVSGILALSIWSYSVVQTSGLITKRYANQDATGREKKDRLGGREVIMGTELTLFKENPVLGVGIGMGKSYREQMLGQEVASHNEITRLLSEHGMFGLFILLILLITPVILFLNNYQNIYFFSFYVFWLLTINHAAMRIAAPAFVYALSLLNVQFNPVEKVKKEMV